MRRRDGRDSIPFDNSAGRYRLSAHESNSVGDHGNWSEAVEGVAEFWRGISSCNGNRLRAARTFSNLPSNGQGGAYAQDDQRSERVGSLTDVCMDRIRAERRRRQEFG